MGLVYIYILYYIILYYIVLYYIILYYTISYHIILYEIIFILYYIISYYIILYCMILYYIISYYIILNIILYIYIYTCVYCWIFMGFHVVRKSTVRPMDPMGIGPTFSPFSMSPKWLVPSEIGWLEFPPQALPSIPITAKVGGQSHVAWDDGIQMHWAI